MEHLLEYSIGKPGEMFDGLVRLRLPEGRYRVNSHLCVKACAQPDAPGRAGPIDQSSFTGRLYVSS
jgi:hypothetical protein